MGQRLASFPGQLWEAEAEFLPELLREKLAGVLVSGARGHKDKVGRNGEPASTCVNEVGRLFCVGSCSGKGQPGFGVRQSWLEHGTTYRCHLQIIPPHLQAPVSSFVKRG